MLCDLIQMRTSFDNAVLRPGNTREDELTSRLAEGYDGNSFACTFKIGSLNTGCAEAYGLAVGASDINFARSRANVTRDKPSRADQRAVSSTTVRPVSDYVHAWIRDCRTRFEHAPKVPGASRKAAYIAPKQTEPQWWEQYQNFHTQQSKEVIGSKETFLKCLREHNEIIQRASSGHGTCDPCGDLLSRKKIIDDMPHGPEKERLLAEYRADKRAHEAFKDTEIEFFNDASFKANHYPEELTTLNIDAPTAHQFDLPRMQGDTPKRLEGVSRWKSKVTACQSFGYGIMVFLVHASVGAGANLMLTCAYMTLLAHAKSGCALPATHHTHARANTPRAR